MAVDVEESCFIECTQIWVKKGLFEVYNAKKILLSFLLKAVEVQT